MLDYNAPADLLRNKIIMVTGASDGIGRVVSRCFAEHGASVIALDRKQRKLETLYDEITGADLPQPILVTQDLRGLDQERAEQIAAGVAHEFGHLDGLLHNAAALPGLSTLGSHDPKEWNEVIQVNLTAPFLLTRSLLPAVKRATAGSILFTSADCGRRGRAYWGAYAAAYGGIERLMELLSDELQVNTRVRVNTLDPGPVSTALRKKTYPGDDPAVLRTAEQISAVYLYLMGDDSRDVRGQALSAQP